MQVLVWVVILMPVVMRLLMAVGVSVLVSVVVVMPVMVSVPRHLKDREPETGEDQNAGDDGVLGALHGGAELESYGDDHASEQD